LHSKILIDELFELQKKILDYCALTLRMNLKLLCRLRELVLRELGFRDIFKKVKVNANKGFSCLQILLWSLLS
jgi:hypothetical protein